MSTEAHDAILAGVIAEHRDHPVDMLGIGDAAGEFEYLTTLADSYRRTIADVVALCPRGDETILELGSFLGAVSVTLRRIGYRVLAADIPEFHASATLRDLYARNDVPFEAVNLRSARLPHADASIDCVVLCEVLEHLNFNPLPPLAEMHRVLRGGGHLYVSMPNQAGILSRLRLLFGRSVHNPIDDFFAQLDRHNNMIVGLHWREYTMAETTELLERMGFAVVGRYFYANSGASTGLFAGLARKLLYLVPSFRPFLVASARKVDAPAHDFLRVDANS